MSIKGITLEIDGNTTALTKALASVNTTSRNLQSELKEVERLLKLDPTNTELLAQKQKLLADSIENAKNKLNELKRIQQQAEEQFASGKLGEDKYRALQREVIQAEQSLARLEARAASTGDGLDNTGKKAEDSGKEAADAKSGWQEFGGGLENVGSTAKTVATAVVATAAGILASLTSLVDKTKELRQDLSRLEQNATSTGNSFETVHGQMSKLVALTDETDSSVEALSNIMASGFEDAKIVDVVNALSGAVINFPDTLKIESLADGLQETLATGQATGQFAELIERMGGSLDDFNSSLEEAATAADKQQAALDWLAKSGLAEVNEAYKEANAGMLEAAEAEYELNEAMAGLATVVEPVLTALKSELSDAVNSIVSFVDSGKSVSEINESMAQSDQTLELVDRYNTLQAKLNDSTMSSEELKAAQDELATVKQKLIEVSDGLISATAEESGVFDEQVASLQKMTEAEKSVLESELMLLALNYKNDLQEKTDLNDKYNAALSAQVAAQTKLNEETLKLNQMAADGASEEALSRQASYVESLRVALEGSIFTTTNLEDAVGKLNEKYYESADAVAEDTVAIKQLVANGMKAEDLAVALNMDLDELNAILGENVDAAGESADEINSLGSVMAETTAEAEDLTKIIEETTEAHEAHAKEVDELTSKTELYKKALDEETASGELSLETVEELIKAGYASVLQIDEETGAVTLNTEAFRNLAAAQWTELAAKKAAEKVSLVEELNAEKAAADSLAAANILLGGSELLSTAAKENKIHELEIEIATYTAAAEEIKNYAASIGSAGGASSAAAKTSSDAFKDAIDDIDYALAIGLITEKEYWEQYVALMSEHLEEGSDEWKDANEKLVKHTVDMHKELQKEVDEAYENGELSLAAYLKESERLRDEYLKDNKTAWTDAYDETMDAVEKIQSDRLQDITDDFNDAKDDLLSAQEDLQSKLSGMASLVTTEKVDGESVSTLTNLSEIKAKLQKYNALISGLKGKIPQSMMAYVLGLSIDDAIVAAEMLTNLSPEELLKESQDWTEIQELSEQIAKETYAPQFEELEKGLLESVTGLTDEMTAAGFDLGGDTAANIVAGIVAGIQDGTIDVENAITQMMEAAQAAADTADDAHSPSRKYIAKGLRGAQSYAMGWDKGGEDVRKAVSNALNIAQSSVSEDVARIESAAAAPLGDSVPNVAESISGALDNMAARMSTALTGSVGDGVITQVEEPIYVDGELFFTRTLKVRRQVDAANPTEVNDF